jgi:hypothetical protein
MKSAKDAAIGVEAVKIAMSQSKDGVKLTLVLHPHEDISELFSHPVGSRYQVALVLVDDEGQPVPIKSREAGDRAVASAGMLCRNPQFQQFMADKGLALSAMEDDVVSGIYGYCGIKSRAELKTDRLALAKFDELRLEFSKTVK